MLTQTTQICQDLATILKIARPYPRELVLETRWAQDDRQKMLRIQDTLRQELNEMQ